MRNLSRIAAIIFLLVLSCAAAARAEFKPAGESATVASVPEKVSVQSSAVRLDGQPLFLIQESALSFTAEERAQAISERLLRLATEGDPTIAFSAVDGEAATDIIAGDRIIMSITDADARSAGRSRQELANAYRTAMQSALASFLTERQSQSLLLSTLYTLAATAGLLLTFWLITRLFRWLQSRIEIERGRVIRTLRFQSIEILSEARMVALLRQTLKGIRVILILVLLNIYLTTVLAFFPWTRHFATRLTSYLLDPLSHVGLAFVGFLPNAVFIAVIIALTYLAIRVTRFAFDEIEKGSISLPGFHSDWAAPTFNIVRFLVIAFAVVVAFPYLPGADSPAFKGVSVFLGVLLSLGSSSAVGNIVAGVIITYMRPFKIGDRVQIAESVGDVVEKTLLITRIRTIKHVDITIPNAMVLSSHMTNYSSAVQEYGLILHTTVTIGYDVPWRQVHELLITAAKETEHILALPPPFVLQTSLDDFYVSYELNAYTDKPSVMALSYSLLHQKIQDQFNAAGVEIMSPHYAQLRDGNAATIPASYLPVDYRPPGFRLAPNDQREPRQTP